MTGAHGKVAMVTGCGGERGLGRGIARRLAADGADLVLTDVAPKGTRVLAAKPAGAWGGLSAVRPRSRRWADGLSRVSWTSARLARLTTPSPERWRPLAESTSS